MADYKFEYKDNEKDIFTFTYTDENNLPIDVSSATFTLMIKEKKDRDAIVTINDVDFDKTDGLQGIARVTVDMSSLPFGKEYFMGVKAAIDADKTKETSDIILAISQSVVG